MRKFTNIAMALSDESRVRALMTLRMGELCVCQLIELLNLAPSTVSRHMSILRQAQLVRARKEGHWNYYRLADDASQDVLQAIQWVVNSLATDQQIVADAERLEHICRVDRKELCACYGRPKPGNNKSTGQKKD